MLHPTSSLQKMAAERLHDQSEFDREQATDNGIGATASTLTFRDAMMIRSVPNLDLALEPLLRKVVREEAELVVARLACRLSRSPSLRIRSPEASSLQLIFAKDFSLPIFTNSEIIDVENSPLQVRLINANSEGEVPASPIKVEIVVLDGDFPGGDDNVDWTSKEFEDSILKPRESKRPLLTGDIHVTLRDGVASIGELVLTDNSSWVRSQQFRLGLKVSSGIYLGKIKEGISVPFRVRDRRGETYKKHFPPALLDEVWRLKHISKGGVLYRKLKAKGIDTVQEFLKMYTWDTVNLSKIMGLEMSDKNWKGIVEHALTCDKGDKLYLYRRTSNLAILLDPICQAVGAFLDGQLHPPNALTENIKDMAKEAYQQWDKLEEVDGSVDPIALSRRLKREACAGAVQAQGTSNDPGANIGQTSQQYFGSTEAGFALPMNMPHAQWEEDVGDLQPISIPMHVPDLGHADHDAFQFITPFPDPNLDA